MVLEGYSDDEKRKIANDKPYIKTMLTEFTVDEKILLMTHLKEIKQFISRCDREGI